MSALSFVRVPQRAHSQVKHAAARLREYLTSLGKVPDRAIVEVKIRKRSVPQAGDEGYAIRSSARNKITIAANTDAGAANGMYGLMMASRTRQMKNPFAETWDLMETPRWSQRRMAVASFLIGLTKMTPDMWTFEDWKQYIDFVRQFNINYLSILSPYMYHPDMPETYQNQWRFDVFRQVIAYAHEHGMKVSLMNCYNQAPARAFWEHPEWRAVGLRAYFGQFLCWSKAKREIMKYQKAIIDYLDGLDGFELIVAEPTGWCLCDQCSSDMGAVFVDAVKEVRRAFRRKNPDGQIIFWNWFLGFIAGWQGVLPIPPGPVKDIARIQPKVFREMPDDVIFLDLSMNQMRNMAAWPGVADRPGQIESLKVAAEGYGRPTINLMFMMDVENGMVDRLSIFPRPFLDAIIDEFEYTKALPVMGVSGYRLAPPGRFLCDFFYMRKSWNPDLTREQLVDEAAAFLTSNAKQKRTIAGAIENIERYWHKRRRKDLIAARDAFQEVGARCASSELRRIRDGLTILAMVDDYARAVKKVDDACKTVKGMGRLTGAREKRFQAVFEAMKQYPIYQGFTSEGFWESRAKEFLLRPNMRMWADYINMREYYY